MVAGVPITISSWNQIHKEIQAFSELLEEYHGLMLISHLTFYKIVISKTQKRLNTGLYSKFQ